MFQQFFRSAARRTARCGIHVVLAFCVFWSDAGCRAEDVKDDTTDAIVAALNAWYQTTKDVRRVHAKLRRTSYDHVFGMCDVSEGEVWYEAPYSGRILIPAVSPPDGVAQVPGRSLDDRRDIDFKAREYAGLNLMSTSTAHIVLIDEHQRRAFAFRPERPLAHIEHLALGLPFGLTPSAANDRFSISLLEKNEDAWVLRFEPRVTPVRTGPRSLFDFEFLSSFEFLFDFESTYKQLDVTIGRSNGFVRKYRAVDRPGTQEVVFECIEVALDPPQWPRSDLLGADELFVLDRTKYRISSGQSLVPYQK